MVMERMDQILQNSFELEDNLQDNLQESLLQERNGVERKREIRKKTIIKGRSQNSQNVELMREQEEIESQELPNQELSKQNSKQDRNQIISSEIAKNFFVRILEAKSLEELLALGKELIKYQDPYGYKQNIIGVYRSKKKELIQKSLKEDNPFSNFFFALNIIEEYKEKNESIPWKIVAKVIAKIIYSLRETLNNTEFSILMERYKNIIQAQNVTRQNHHQNYQNVKNKETKNGKAKSEEIENIENKEVKTMENENDIENRRIIHIEELENEELEKVL